MLHHRKNLFKEILELLGLDVPMQNSSLYTQPLPQYLTSSPSQADAVAQVLERLGIILSDEPYVLQDAEDTFHFHRSTYNPIQVLSDASSKSKDSDLWQPKHVIVYTRGDLPPPTSTTLFSFRTFYDILATVRTQNGCSDKADPWGIGEILLYGEAVTSTQTMLDKYVFKFCTTSACLRVSSEILVY